jgi:hypothetical protein
VLATRDRSVRLEKVADVIVQVTWTSEDKVISEPFLPWKVAYLDVRHW